MSWLGSGLSQITGQISNFTKEVLTEGTEEVDDHVTELRLAKSSVVDLEGQNNHQKAELDRLRHINEELLEKLHSSELQINKLSHEYRSTLQNKEDEVKRLKHEHNEILDMHGKLAVATEVVSASHSRNPSASTLEDFGADQHDFDDIISSQHEINRLRLENQRLGAECRHWKNLANVQGTGDAVGCDEASLHHRIQDLESELNAARDRHQHELAELQDLHRQKLSVLKRQHKDELSQLPRQLEQKSAASQETEVVRLREQLQTQKLVIEEVSQLRDQLQEREQEKEMLSEEVEQLQEALMQFKTRSPAVKPMVQAQLDPRSLSTIPLSSATPSPLVSPSKSPESLILDYSEEHMRVRQLERDLRSAEESIERLESEQSRLVTERETLRKSLEATIGQLKAEKTVIVKDNQSLEASVAALREQLQMQEQELQKSDSTAGEVTGMMAKLTDCQTQLEALTQDNMLLTVERDTLRRERTAMLSEKTELEEEMSNQKALLSAMEVNHQQQVTAIREEADGAATQLDQIETLSERECKLSREVDRLRSHLLSIEDGYTQEALAAEEREKELRTRLVTAEDRALSSSNAVQNASAAASEQVESLQEQLSAMSEQRDAVVMQLASAQETASQYATSLANLQMVLEQFTHEREHAQALEVEHSRQQMVMAIAERDRLKNNLASLQDELDTATAGLEAAHRLSEQLDRREEVIRALKEEVVLRENELKRSEEEIRMLNNVNEGRVEKALVRNLFLGYFHSPRGKRDDVLRVIGKVLTFSSEEMQQIGLESGTSWLGGLFTFAGSKSANATGNQGLDKSFSELFVKFLERESTPAMTMRLPAEEMARDTQQRKELRPKAAFNPFAAPIGSSGAAVSHPLVAGQGTNALFSPILPADTAGSLTTSMDTRQSPALLATSGTFPNPATRASPGLNIGLPPQPSPSLVNSGYPPPGPSLVGPSQAGGSARASAGNSGRSTPASSSAFLSSVLQQ